MFTRSVHCVLQLAPGGHVGRFIVWTKSAFEKLDSIFGTTTEASGMPICRLMMLFAVLPVACNWRSSQEHREARLQCSAPQGTLNPWPHLTSQVSATKKGYKLPRSLLTNSDLARLINSDEIQSVVNAPKVQAIHPHRLLQQSPWLLVGRAVLHWPARAFKTSV
jgi:large subunit ribosomal protein L4e